MERRLKAVRVIAIFLVFGAFVLVILGGKWWFSVYLEPQGIKERITADLPRHGMLADHRVSISGDGRWVAFSDFAQINGGSWTQGVMVHDRASNKTMRISKGYDGSPENMGSHDSMISANGRFVVFVSSSSNLVPVDANVTYDVFIYDLLEEKTRLVSISTQGLQADFESSSPSISADGNMITFLSDADNLVSRDTNGVRDVFLHDCVGGETTRIVAGTDDDQTNGIPYLPVISADGRFIVFYHEDPSHVAETGQYITRVVLYDRQNADITRLAEIGWSPTQYHIPGELSISGDGRYVILPVWRIREVENHVHYWPAWLILDRITGKQKPILQGQTIFEPAISADGRYIVFVTGDTNLVKGDNNGQVDVYVLDQMTGRYTRVSVSSYGDQGNRGAYSPAISADVHHIVFVSDSRNLSAHDTNGAADIFVHDMGDQHVYSRGKGAPPSGAPYPPVEFPLPSPSAAYPYPPVEFHPMIPTRESPSSSLEFPQLTPSGVYPFPMMEYP